MISPSGAAGCTPASRRLRQNSNLPFFHHRDVGLWSNLSKSDLWVLPTFSDKPRFRWAMGQKVCWGFSKENQPAEDVIHNGWLIFTIWIIFFGYGSRLLTRWPKMFVILRGNQPFFVISTNERIICFFFGCGVHMPGMIYDNDHQLQSNGIQNHQLFSSWSSVMVPTVSRTMWESFENQSTNWRKKWWTSIPKSVFQVKGWHFWVREDGRTLHFWFLCCESPMLMSYKPSSKMGNGNSPAMAWKTDNTSKSSDFVFWTGWSNSVQACLVGGFNQPLWKIMEFVSWDDFPFPTEWKVIQNSMVPVTTNQVIINH